MRGSLLAMFVLVLVPLNAVPEPVAGSSAVSVVAEAKACGGNVEGEDSPETDCREGKCFFWVICPGQPGGPDGPFHHPPDWDKQLKDIMTRSDEALS